MPVLRSVMSEISASATDFTAPRRRGIRVWVRSHLPATFFLSLLLFVLALRLLWDWHASWQLEKALADIRSRGGPVTAADIVIEPLPDSENAWVVHLQAIAAIKPNVNSPRSNVLEYPHYPPYGKEWEALAEASEKAHAQVFALARRARKLERAQLRSAAPTVGNFFTPNLNGARHLANTLADAAQFSHLRGNDAEAVERLLDLMHLGRSLRQDPQLISQLVGIGINALACDAIQQIAPNLKLDPKEPGATSPKQVRSLIEALLDEDAAWELMVQSMLWERVFILDHLEAKGGQIWALRPLLDRTALRWLAGLEDVLSASRQSSFAAAREILESMEPDAENSSSFPLFGPAPQRTVPRYSRWFDESGPGTFGRYIEQFYRVTAERRTMAVILAARLYREDYRHWPPDLGALVPRYLQSVPIDPFPAGAPPLGFVVLPGALPDGSDRPLVYFEAGEAQNAVIDTEPMIGWQMDRRIGKSQRRIRQYRDVSLWLPKTRRFDEEQNRFSIPSFEESGE